MWREGFPSDAVISSRTVIHSAGLLQPDSGAVLCQRKFRGCWNPPAFAFSPADLRNSSQGTDCDQCVRCRTWTGASDPAVG